MVRSFRPNGLIDQWGALTSSSGFDGYYLNVGLRNREFKKRKIINEKKKRNKRNEKKKYGWMDR